MAGLSFVNNVLAISPTHVSLYASPISVPYNGSSTLTWSSFNMEYCTATTGWSGQKGNSGNEVINNITSSATYVLVCKELASNNFFTASTAIIIATASSGPDITVMTDDADNITATTAILRGRESTSNILPNGCTSATNYSPTTGQICNSTGATSDLDATAYFRYSASSISPIFCNDIYGSNMISTKDILLGTASAASFYQPITSLTPDTTYYYCAIISNKKKIIYGGESVVKKFHTNCYDTTFSTKEATQVTDTTATLNGSYCVTNKSDTANEKAKTSFVYNEVWGFNSPSNPSKIVSEKEYTLKPKATSHGNLSFKLTGLKPNTTYQFNAIVGKESEALHNGSVLTFTTEPRRIGTDNPSGGGISFLDLGINDLIGIIGGNLPGGVTPGGTTTGGTTTGGTTPGGTTTGGTTPGGTTAIDTTTGGTTINNNISNGTISNVNISGGSISNSTINGMTMNGGTITSATITSGTISNGTITNGTITNGTINNGTISNGIISSGSTSGGSISGGTIANGTISSGIINSGNISSGNISSGTISGGILSAGVLTSGSITNGTITNGTITGATISTASGRNITNATIRGVGVSGVEVDNNENITSGTITSGTISSGTISNGTISSGTINSGTISSGAITSGTITGGVTSGGIAVTNVNNGTWGSGSDAGGNTGGENATSGTWGTGTGSGTWTATSGVGGGGTATWAGTGNGSGTWTSPTGSGTWTNGTGTGGAGTGTWGNLVLGQKATPPNDAIVRYHEGIETVFTRQIINNPIYAKTYGYQAGTDLQTFAWDLSDQFARMFGYINENRKEIRVSFPDIAAYQLQLVGNKLTVYEYYDEKIVDIRNLTTVFKNASGYEYYFQK